MEYTASNKEMCTCAVGIYQKPGVFIGHKSGSVGPLFLDIDIFPENQKMTTINCNFEYINFDLLPFTIPVVDAVMSEISDTGGYQIAWRATANGLRETVKDMYKGELIVIGDPSVKPYDKIFINDLYEDMQGICDVETVVHTFSTESGFTTSITPDCISAIDNKYEQIAHATTKEMLAPFFYSHAILCATSMKFSNITRSMFFAANKSLDLGVDFAHKATNSITKVIGKDELAMFPEYTESISKKLGFAFGVTPTDLSVYKELSKLEDSYKILNVDRKFASSKDLTKFIDDLLKHEDTLKYLDPKDLNKLLEQDQANPLDPRNKKIMEKARKDAMELQSSYSKISKTSLSKIQFSESDIQEIIKQVNASFKDKIQPDEIKKALSLLEESKNIKYVDNIADITKELNALKTVLAHVPDLATDSKVAVMFTNLDKTVFKNYSKRIKRV